MPHFEVAEKLPRSKLKFIKSLRLKKYRFQENFFAIEGDKHVKLLLESDYEVQMMVGTAGFLALHGTLLAHRAIETFQVGQDLLASFTYQA